MGKFAENGKVFTCLLDGRSDCKRMKYQRETSRFAEDNSQLRARLADSERVISDLMGGFEQRRGVSFFSDDRWVCFSR